MPWGLTSVPRSGAGRGEKVVQAVDEYLLVSQAGRLRAKRSEVT